MFHKPAIEFGIIGLGRFGFALAFTLTKAVKEVLAPYSNESEIRQIRNLISTPKHMAHSIKPAILFSKKHIIPTYHKYLY